MKLAYHIPSGVLCNAELSALYPDWTPEKIHGKTGISERHVAAVGETASDLAEQAARKLFSECGVAPADIDYVLFCTQSPDYRLPTSACLLQHRLGLPKSIGALDFNLGCSGFVYGLSLAKGLVAGRMARNVLLLTGETYTKYIHPQDRSVRTIFGDGASATLVDEDAARRLGEFVFGTDGSGADWLKVPNGGARHAVDPRAEERTDRSGGRRTDNDLFMSGVDIFRFTLDVVPRALDELCRRNGITRDDIDLYVFHQANAFMLETIRTVTRIPCERFVVDLEDVGNTVSASIPIALVRAEASGRLRPGMRVALMGFGVGLSWCATLVDW